MKLYTECHQQAQLADVFIAAPDAIVTLDAHQRIVLFNPAAERLFGCSASAARSRPVSYFIPDLRYERGRRQNGEEFPLEAAVSYSQVHGQDTITVILRDVTRQKRLEEQLRTQKQLFENLVAVARATGEQLTLGPTLHNVLEVGVALTSAERGSLFLLDAQGSVIDTLAVREAAPIGERHRVVSHVRGQGLLGWVITHRQPVFIHDTRLDDRWVQLPDAAAPTRSALAVPILHGTALLGVLILIHSQAQCFTAEHFQLIQAAAHKMSLALQNATTF
jgi:PAS domain-containing protein